MRALTIHEPWASLIMAGLKRFETRGRKTNVRGPLAIHAALKPMSEEGIKLAEKYGITPKYGMVIGTVELAYCLSIASEDKAVYPNAGFAIQINKQEQEFGWFEKGRFAWRMKVLEKFETPIPAKGQQGFWKWDERTVME